MVSFNQTDTEGLYRLQNSRLQNFPLEIHISKYVYEPAQEDTGKSEDLYI